MQHKGNVVSLQVQTARLGIGANPKQAGTSFGKKTVHNPDITKNNPLYVIPTLLIMYREVPPSMIDVGLIIPWDIFKTLCAGTSVTEFNDILFKASGEKI